MLSVLEDLKGWLSFFLFEDLTSQFSPILLLQIFCSYCHRALAHRVVNSLSFVVCFVDCCYVVILFWSGNIFFDSSGPFFHILTMRVSAGIEYIVCEEGEFGTAKNFSSGYPVGCFVC